MPQQYTHLDHVVVPVAGGLPVMQLARLTAAGVPPALPVPSLMVIRALDDLYMYSNRCLPDMVFFIKFFTLNPCQCWSLHCHMPPSISLYVKVLTDEADCGFLAADCGF